VSSIDGVVAGHGLTPGAISLRSEADRFMMGLLRACAGAVVIGAGTFRPDPRHRWTPGHVYPPAADAFARLRRDLGYRTDPALVVVTASGRLGDELDALIPGSLVVTTRAGADALGGRLPPGAEVVALADEGPVPVRRVTRLLAERGHRRVLSEGGPRLFGELIAEGLVDELFLTLSPVLLGGLPGAVGPAGDLPLWNPAASAHPPPVPLLGVRRHRCHLFLRYALRGVPPSPPGGAPGP
jgi:riboflavin biosynthesis pyrimidine reductase